jgi:hypothetical protein
MKTFLTVFGGGLAGGLIGQSKVLCLTGECAITGSWYGGAMAGGLIALALMSMFVGGKPGRAVAPDDEAGEPKSE